MFSTARRQQLRVSMQGAARRSARILHRHFWVNTDGYSVVLNWAAALSIVLLVLAMWGTELRLLPVEWSVGAIFVTMALGLFVFVCLVEKLLAKHLLELRTSQLFWIGGLALASYLARGQAGDEVNAIFAQDAASFPYATTAATAMIVGAWTQWFAFGIGVFSLVYAFWLLFRSRYPLVLAAGAVGLHLISWSAFAAYQMGSESVRRNNIYQVALAMDFNGRYHCDGARLGQDTVAFIGPAQDSALVAPPLVVERRNPGSIFKTVTVPAQFDRVRCR